MLEKVRKVGLSKLFPNISELFIRNSELYSESPATGDTLGWPTLDERHLKTRLIMICSLKESIDELEIIVCGKMFHCTIVCGKK
jgi:hypothetical protein